MRLFLGLFLNLHSPVHLSHSNEMEYDFSASMFMKFCFFCSDRCFMAPFGSFSHDFFSRCCMELLGFFAVLLISLFHLLYYLLLFMIFVLEIVTSNPSQSKLCLLAWFCKL